VPVTNKGIVNRLEERELAMNFCKHVRLYDVSLIKCFDCEPLGLVWVRKLRDGVHLSETAATYATLQLEVGHVHIYCIYMFTVSTTHFQLTWRKGVETQVVDEKNFIDFMIVLWTLETRRHFA
jgi:hypothetical protein